MTKHHSTTTPGRIVRIGLLTMLAAALAPTAAHAAYYQVATSSIPADKIDATDGYCSLGEAIKSINDGRAVTNCKDLDSTNPGMITLIEAPNKSYASYHYVVSSLTVSKSVRIQPSEEGFTAFVDSTGGWAFKVLAGADVTLYGLKITHLPPANGRGVWNEGTLWMANVTVTGANVKTEQLGIGGGVYNKGTIGLSNCTIQGNSAKKGAGLYNDAGVVLQLNGTVSTNTATMAGGGIYNVSTTPAGTPVNGKIEASGLTLKSNTAPAGGGIFNRGEINLTDSSITSNSTSGTGSSEPCGSLPSCDGFGGAVLSVHKSGAATRFMLLRGTLSSNKATKKGGALYSAGVVELGGVTMNKNTAPDGAALWVEGPTDGSGQYCHIYGDADLGPTAIKCNVSGASGYSIVSGGNATLRKCIANSPGYLTAVGNSSPFCAPGTIDTDNSTCPQVNASNCPLP